MSCSARATPKRTRPGDSASVTPSVKKVSRSPGCSAIGAAAGTTVSSRTPSGRLVLSRIVVSMPDVEQIAPLAGAGVDHRPVAGIEPGHGQGDEVEIAGVGGQQAVGAGENLAHVAVDLRQRPQAGPRLRHQQRRAHAVAADVADDDAEAAVEHGNVVEIVAGGGLGGKQRAGNVETGEHGRLGRIEPLLDLLGGPELLRRVAHRVFGAMPPAALDGVADRADQQLVVDLALDQVVLAPACTAFTALASSL